MIGGGKLVGLLLALVAAPVGGVQAFWGSRADLPRSVGLPERGILQQDAAPGEICIRRGAPVMGTILQVNLCGKDRQRLGAAADLALQRAAELDAALTTFVEASPLSKLNRASGESDVALPDATLEALRVSTEMVRRTGGAFDPTVGALVRLWRDASVSGHWPKPHEIRAARAAVGIEGLRLGTDRARLLRRGAAVDLGGIGKGFALDKIVKEMKGIDGLRGLLDFGGSSQHAIGAPPGEGSAALWRIALPGPDGREIGVVRLRDAALSVSASRGQMWVIDGRRVGHIMDPRRGEPIDAVRVAVVAAPRGALAEALSTALVVEGPGGLDALVAAEPGVAALVVEESGAITLRDELGVFELREP